jgi:integrase
MSAEHVDRGWYLHFREAEQQWELCYRVAVEPADWRKHRIKRGSVHSEADAERYAVVWLKERKRLGLLGPVERWGTRVSDPAEVPTFGSFATRWASGKLHTAHPDHVRLKDSSDDDATRADVLSRAIGAVPLKDFTLAHAEEAMRQLDELRQARERDAARAAERKPRRLKPLSRSSRRQYAQLIARTLKLAVYPARVIPASPLPSGWLPRGGGSKPIAHLYPDEDGKLMACARVPLVLRLLFGFLSREGMREGEALAMRWRDLDLVRGAVTLDENKTDDPRCWALHPGVAAALLAWKERRAPREADGGLSTDEAKREAFEEERVFTADDGRPISAYGLADTFRASLKLAGVSRAELHESKGERMAIRVHDLRATFVTISLANGKTEAWVASRTGHRSSAMINRYRRAAQKVDELGLGNLKPLDEAIAELAPPCITIVVRPEPPRVPLGDSNGMPTVSRIVSRVVSEALSRVRRGRSTPRNRLVGRAGLEPATYGLKVRSSTD